MGQDTDKEKPNAHVTEYLGQYIDKKNPEFAVLLTGKWGIGKTYFIDAYIENYERERKEWEEKNKNKDSKLDRATRVQKPKRKKLVKISLFGLKTIDQLNETIFSSCVGKDVGNLIKVGSAVGNVVGLLPGLSKIGDTVKDIAKKYEQPLTDYLKDYFSKGEQIVYVLDDLERSDIPLKELLGWINEKVEIEKESVILIANEEKLIIAAQDTNDQKDEEARKKEKIYKEFKEKVIGETLEIQSDLEGVLEYFLKHTEEKNRQYLPEYKQVVLGIYRNFYGDQQPNLRQLRQAIGTFEDWLKRIDEKYLKNKDFVSRLIQNFFVLKLVIVEYKLTKQDFSEENVPSKQYDVGYGMIESKNHFLQKPKGIQGGFAKIEDKKPDFFNFYLYFFSTNLVK